MERWCAYSVRAALAWIPGVVICLTPWLADAAPIDTKIKQVVAFVFKQMADPQACPSNGVQHEGKRLCSWGTGFFVAVTSPDKKKTTTYFATARHLFQKPDPPFEDATDPLFLRVNKSSGGTDVLRIPHRADGTPTYFAPQDESVDLAVIPIPLNWKVVEHLQLGQDMITSKEKLAELKIREGTDVYFTGLFPPYIGSKQNDPITRFGRVALIPTERIRLQEGRPPADLYLLETGSFGGNSGSPVFFYLGSDRTPGTVSLGKPIQGLIGVMSGTFLDVNPLEAVETKKRYYTRANMGIAAVVPAYKLRDLLFSERLKKERGF